MSPGEVSIEVYNLYVRYLWLISCGLFKNQFFRKASAPIKCESLVVTIYTMNLNDRFCCVFCSILISLSWSTMWMETMKETKYKTSQVYTCFIISSISPNILRLIPQTLVLSLPDHDSCLTWPWYLPYLTWDLCSVHLCLPSNWANTRLTCLCSASSNVCLSYEFNYKTILG